VLHVQQLLLSCSGLRASLKKVAQDFGDRVEIVEIETTPETVRRYGTADPLINGKIKLFGPVSKEDVKKTIQEEIEQFKH